jgi:hypothetical protein
MEKKSFGSIAKEIVKMILLNCAEARLEEIIN